MTTQTRRHPRARYLPYELPVITLMVALLSLASTRYVLAQATANVEGLMQSGSAAMHQGQPEQAEKSFRDAVRLAPRLALAHLDLGLTLVQQGKLEEASQELSTAVQIDRLLPGASMFLGITEYELGQVSEARTALKSEIENHPDNAEASMWLGVVELSTGHPEAAVAPLDRAAQLSPDNLDILDYRARAHSLVASSSYARLARLSPDSWHVHRALGQSYGDQGQPKKAIDEYLAAIKANPRNPDLYEALGDEYRKVAQFELAKKAYETELSLSPNNPVALFNLGSIHIDRDNPAVGVPMVEKAAQRFDKAAPVYFYLGLGMAKMDRNQEAVEYLAKAITADPGGELVERAYYEQSRAYRKLGKTKESGIALAEFTRLRDAHPATK